MQAKKVDTLNSIDQYSLDDTQPIGKDTPIKSVVLKDWRTLLLVALAGFCASIFVIELGFRFFSAIAPKTERWSDRPAKFYLGANESDRPRPDSFLPRNENTFRILALGDSFTYGQGMQRSDAYPARVEKLLNLVDSGQPFEVLNWGVRGYSTYQEFELLQRGFTNVDPQLVILQITLNDPEIEPYRVTHKYLDAHGRVNLSHPIFDYWHSLHFVVSRILNTETRREYSSYYSDLYDNPKTWGLFSSSLANINKFLKEKKTPLFATIFPLFSHRQDKGYPFISLHSKIEAELDRLGIPFIDLKDRYSMIPSERLQLIPGVDSHPNEIAHRIASEAIFTAIRKERLVPGWENKPNILSER